MPDRQPPEMAQVAGETGAKKVHRTWDRVLVSAFLGGAYIAFGALINSILLHQSFINGLYFSVVSIETIGLPDVPVACGTFARVQLLSC